MQKIIKLLKNYNLDETSPINLLRESSDNKIFIIGEKNKKILRISKRLPIEDIKFEYDAIKYFSANGVSVPMWVMTKTGSFYTLINDKIAIVVDFLNGHSIKVDRHHFPTQAQAYNAGKELGLMSNVAAGFTPSSSRKRNIFSELERAIILSDIFTNQFKGGEEFINQVRDAVKFGRDQDEVQGLIHNDYRPSNVFVDENDKLVGVIDFDWSCMGPTIKDLALAILEWSFPDGAAGPDPKIFDSFLEGYNSVAIHKRLKNKELYLWIRFAALSDASTYFCDLIEDTNSTKRTIESYMYKKYLFFSRNLEL